MAVVIETTLGDITVDLYLQERPKACLNFLKLCQLKYYNFSLFHTVERGFIAQTGDPTGVGDGGESVWGVVEGNYKRFFQCETIPKIKHAEPGLLSLVSVGKNMVGSQFFFTLGADLTSLDGIHCVIGEVTEGHEILRKLNEAIVDEKFRPFQDIRVTHTVVLEDPFENPRGFRIPSRSPSPSTERLQNGRIGADEDIDDTDGKTAEEIQEILAEREAKARATILEIVGDLPDADVAPPENVLFICKLNPVTNDDDLEIIFSRFGKVKGCEVIRDKVSGESLQYAFVEFVEQKSCENAYFKMDNVLIDDRRIHVDFSQSVAKVRWRGKGRGIIHENEDNYRLDFNNLRGNKNHQTQRRSSPKNANERNYDRNYQNKRKMSYNHSKERNRSRSPNGKHSKEYPERFSDRRSNDYKSQRYDYDYRRNRNFNERDNRDNRNQSFDRRSNTRSDYKDYKSKSDLLSENSKNENAKDRLKLNKKERSLPQSDEELSKKRKTAKHKKSKIPKQKKDKSNKKKKSKRKVSTSDLSNSSSEDEGIRKKKNKKQKKIRRNSSNSNSDS